MAEAQTGRVIGHGPCPHCGHPAAYKLNKKGHVYIYCDVEGNGGCHTGNQSRSAKGDAVLVRHITKWTSPDDRARLMGDGPPAVSTAEPKKVSFWDKEII